MNTKEKLLLEVFCKDEYEKIEMKKWIQQKGIDYVYELVTRYGKEDKNNEQA